MKHLIFITFVASAFFIGIGWTVMPYTLHAASFDLPNISCPAGINCTAVSNADVAENPAAYIARLYQIALAVAGVLAVGIIVVGSLFYTFAGGSTDRQREGKEMIISALWGIALLFGSYLILQTVNPRLTQSFGFIGGPLEVKVPTFSASRGSCSLYAISGINCDDKDYVQSGYKGDLKECNTDATNKFLARTNDCRNYTGEFSSFKSGYPGGGLFAYDGSRSDLPATCHPIYKRYVGESSSSTTEANRNVIFNPLKDDGVSQMGWAKGKWGFCL